MASANKKSFEYDSHTLPNGENFKFHLVVSEWNKAITFSLSSAATNTLLEAGVKEENILIWRVPGSFELIYGSKKAQKNTEKSIVYASGAKTQKLTKKTSIHFWDNNPFFYFSIFLINFYLFPQKYPFIFKIIIIF